MKVILTNNVPKLGEVGEICRVSDGYGRNFLIPQGLAILATDGGRKRIDDLKRSEVRRQDRVRFEMEALAKRIEALRLSFTAKVGETGRLYGSITSSDIAAAIEAEIDTPIDRRKIALDDTIRTLGEQSVPIHLMPGVTAVVKLDVVADSELVQDIPVEADENSDVDEHGVADAMYGGYVPSDDDDDDYEDDDRD